MRHTLGGPALFIASGVTAFAVARAALPDRSAPGAAARGASVHAPSPSRLAPNAPTDAPPRFEAAGPVGDATQLDLDLRGHGVGVAWAWPRLQERLVLALHQLGAGPSPERAPMLECIHGDAAAGVRMWIAIDSDGPALRGSAVQILAPELSATDRACLEDLLAPGVELDLAESERPAPPLHLAIIAPLVLDPRALLDEHSPDRR